MITIILVDNHSITRAGVLSILGDVPEFNIIGIAQSESEAVELLKQFHPMILLVDYQTIIQESRIDANWSELLNPSIKTLILNAEQYQAYISPFLHFGVVGILEKRTNDDELIGAIRNIAEGGVSINQNQLYQMHKWEDSFVKKWQDLTTRERQILELISKGFENKQVAFSLGITIKTVSFHISNLLLKLELNSRQELAQWAYIYFSNGQGNLPG